MDDEYKLTRWNFELALLEMGRYYNTHLVNNDGEEDGFVVVAVMCEDPEDHMFISKQIDASPTLPGELKKHLKDRKKIMDR